jgi:hypothetical protein
LLTDALLAAMNTGYLFWLCRTKKSDSIMGTPNLVRSGD